MKNQATPIELLNRFLNENTDQYIQSVIDEIDQMKFEGPTVEEYFKAMHIESSPL
jgi:hypothetical protein